MSQRPKAEIIKLGSVEIGSGDFVMIAGPCSIESEEQFLTAAQGVVKAGAALLRGGIYKLRTSPQSFQGLGSSGLETARKVAQRVALPLVSEVVDPRHIADLHDYVDVFQVGTRNMYNYALLKELGKTSKPVLLKRAFSALVEEWLLAAEYIVSSGNSQVILCERGIRTFERVTRNTLDLGAVAWLKRHSRLPVLVDPSHGTGVSELVAPMMLAAAASGADGLLVEVHHNPKHALSDGHQALTLDEFADATLKVEALLKSLGRKLARPVK